MNKVFICSPFGGDIEGNIRRAIKYCQEEIEKGNCPFAPHLLYPQMLDENIPEHRALGIRLGIEMLKRCDDLRVCGDRITPGMLEELKAWKIYKFGPVTVDYKELKTPEQGLILKDGFLENV
jgi:hypothetical protein